jgi:hypothetical protein
VNSAVTPSRWSLVATFRSCVSTAPHDDEVKCAVQALPCDTTGTFPNWSDRNALA